MPDIVDVLPAPTELKQRDPVDGTFPVLDGTVEIRHAETGELLAAQVVLDRHVTEPVRHELLHTNPCRLTDRADSGLTYRWRSFGYRPRAAHLGRDYAGAQLLTSERPALAAKLEDLADILDGTLAAVHPTQHQRQHELSAAIHSDWRLGRTAWTSGIINDTAALDYHRDAGNRPGVWSAMVIMRRFARGGHLAIPELGFALSCVDNAVVIFPGAERLHGVTPFTLRDPAAYRFSLVFYQLRGFDKVLSVEDEYARGVLKRTERERAMAQPGHTYR